MSEESKSILDFIQGIDYPERDVLLYWDTVALLKVLELENRIKASSGEEQNALDKEKTELEDRIIREAIRVTIKGTPPRLSKDIGDVVEAQIKEQGLTGEEADSYRILETTKLFLKSHMVKVVVGDRTESPVSDKTLDYILDELPITESERLMRAVADLNHNSVIATLEKKNLNFS